MWRYIRQSKESIERTFTPLIDWDYENPTTSPVGSSFMWKNLMSLASYRSIYDDGRYARFVYPLKQPFTDFDELLVVFASNNESVDQDTRTFKTDVFDFLLKFPINNKAPNLYSVNTPNDYLGHWLNLWLPYDGSDYYPKKEWYSKSTPQRLVNVFQAEYSYPILEIYGIK